MPRLASPRTLAYLVAVLMAGAPAPRAAHPRHSPLRETQSAASLAPAAQRAGHAARRSGRTAVSSEAVFEAMSWSPADVRERLDSEATGTYIDEMLAAQDSSLARWPSRRETPLRVWVQPAPGLASWDAGYVDRVREAFRDWEALGIPVRFEFVPDSAGADVHVSWVEQFREPISGKTVWARNDSWWIVDGNITIALRHSGGGALDRSAIKAIALHEVGHLLGLDHTSDPANIMAPRVRVRELSAADRATMRLLYDLPAGRVR
jgi:predicted Zn-dependent protease